MVVSTSELLNIIEVIGYEKKISFAVSKLAIRTLKPPRKENLLLGSIVGFFLGGCLFGGNGYPIGLLIGIVACCVYWNGLVSLRPLSDIVRMDFSLQQHEKLSTRLKERVTEVKELNAFDLLVRLLKNDKLRTRFVKELNAFIKEQKNVKKESMKAGYIEETCCICCDRPKKIAFMCGHSACYNCARMLDKCHMCQSPIRGRITLY